MLSLIDLKNVYKSYFNAEELEQVVLKNISLSISHGEMIAIIGASGSGKSTLMNIIGLLDTPTRGEYIIDGIEAELATTLQLSKLRNKKIGFVFQSYFLLPRLNVIDNVVLPLTYRAINDEDMYAMGHKVLQQIGVGHLAYKSPMQLSGGQKQRVAIARALVGEPSIILADEPTGALDSKTGNEVMDIFTQLNHLDKKTIIIVTHDPKIAEKCKRVIEIRDGEIILDQGAICD